MYCCRRPPKSSKLERQRRKGRQPEWYVSYLIVHHFDHCPHGVHLISSRPSLQAAFIGAMAIADLVKTTLGPKGMVSPACLLCDGLPEMHERVRPDSAIYDP
jgi:hypothetical protein